MQPLLRISTVPIEISYSTKRAQLSGTYKPPRAQVTRTRGNADIQTNPMKVKIDSSEARASAGLKSTPRLVEEFASTGRADAITATREIAEQGNYIMDSHGKGNPVAEMAMTKVMTTAETIMTFIPSVRPEMWAEGGTIDFDFSADRLSYDWNVNTRAQLEYVPGNIEFTVSQYPDVIIEYIGSPIYVPPSADPNYEAPALDVTT